MDNELQFHDYMIHLTRDRDFQKSTAKMLKEASHSEQLFQECAPVLEEMSKRFDAGNPTMIDVECAIDIYQFQHSCPNIKNASATAAILTTPVILSALNTAKSITNVGASTVAPTVSNAGSIISTLDSDYHNDAENLEVSRARTLQYKIMTYRLKSLLEEARNNKSQKS